MGNDLERNDLAAAGNPEEMALHWLTLAFRDHQAGLEDGFLERYFQRNLPIVRVTAFFAFLFYGLFGILDVYLLPERRTVFWAIRYGLVCPLSLGVFLLTYQPVFRKIYSVVLLVWEIVAGAGIIVMIALAKPPVSYSYYAGLILVFMLGYTVVMQRFLHASLAGWLLVLLYEAVALALDMPVEVLVSNNFFFISANFIGMFAAYAIEYSLRREYFAHTLLEAEREKVRRVNETLEKKVEERTRQLRREMEEKQRVESQLLRHQKMESIGMMAGGVAHDLNNILSGIVNYPEILLRQLPPDDAMRRPLAEIVKSGRRAAAIVEDLLTVARGVASQRELVDLNRLVREYLWSPEFRKLSELHPEVVLKTELDPALPCCHCSPVHIQKVLMNLVTNAFEAVPGGGRVFIGTAGRKVTPGPEAPPGLKAGHYLLLQVSDTGPGISGDDLPHIFEPFFSRKVLGRSGTGLGLSVVWSTVQEHGGTVEVESGSQGTCFSVYLPRAGEEEGKKQAEGQGEDVPRGEGSILVVDDDQMQRDLGRQMLSLLGYQVETAASGEEAVAYLQAHRVDLVLLDMFLGDGMNGLETYRQISKVRPGQKAIIVSGFSESDEVKEAITLGVDRFLKKPCPLTELGRAVREVLARG